MGEAGFPFVIPRSETTKDLQSRRLLRKSVCRLCRRDFRAGTMFPPDAPFFSVFPAALTPTVILRSEVTKDLVFRTLR